MSLETPLNVSPYFDDYDQLKDFYRILFKPSIGVQVRELNQLQTILQSQLERMGDNIFKRGTIINGCNFSFETNLPYVKLLDTNSDGEAITVSDYKGFLVSGGTTGLRAYIVNTYAGFVSTDPDLNTLYVKYTSGGSNNSTLAFVNNEILTIYDANNSIWKVAVDGGASLYSNNDTVVFVSAITVSNSSGGNVFVNSTSGACTFSVGQTIVGGTSTANLVITEVNTTVNSTSIVLKVRPTTSDITAASANSARWTLTNAELISVSGGVQGANVTSLIGSGAAATLLTDASGTISNVALTNRGTGYYAPPYATVASNTGAFSTLVLTSRNYYAKINVATIANSTGYGYGFGVTEGVIYQKGFFQRVEAQNIIISKYSNSPDQLSVGFVTEESIINSASDSSLLDNSTGTSAQTAPGADRLSLSPTLEVKSTTNASSNDSFFIICQWTGGKPNRQLQKTQYNVIEQEMAQRMYESSGNFVTDPFFVNSQSPSTQNLESNTFLLLIDPGVAYIDGYRVQSQYNYSRNRAKGMDTATVSNNAISLNYGNYIRVNHVGGLFQFNSGDSVSLYDTAQQFLSNTSTFNAAISPTGTVIGTARIRSLVYEGGGDLGMTSAVYRLYLFDIVMNAGKNFAETRAIYYNNTALSRKGIADVVVEPSLTTGANAAVLKNPIGVQNQLVFYSGVPAVKNSNNINYNYRTIKTANCNTSGLIVATLSAVDETFPYTAGSTLTSGQLSDVIIVPQANIVASVNVAGTISVNTTSANIVGTGTVFTSNFTSGDYVRVDGGASGNTTKRIVSVVNNTLMVADSNCSFANATAGAYLMFPGTVPITLNRSTRSANINGTGKTLTVNLGNTFTSNVNVDITYTVYVANATIVTKTPNRNVYVKIKANTNPANTVGPWLLGVPDIFRLRGVWQGSNATFSDSDGQNVTDHFFIDHNQNENYYDLGYLYKKPTSNLTISTDDAFIVKFDCFTVAAGAMATYKSYPVDDTKTLDQLDSSGTTVNLLEIPEMYTSTGSYIDLRDAFDFRPRVANTANLAPNTSVMTTDPAYPNTSIKFGNTANSSADFKFPTPQSGLNCVMEKYLGRTDVVVVNGNGFFQVVKGISGNNAPQIPVNSIVINYLKIPPYPSLPKIYSSNLALIADTKISNQRFLNKRINDYTISIPISPEQIYTVQPQAYSMAEIGKLERRIKALEYYQLLTLIEASFNNKVIPSSANSSINRFKFGFFIDDFKNQNFSDLQNPEYNATVVNGMLTAKKDHLNFKFRFANNNAGKFAMLPYEEYPILQQLNATDGSGNTSTNTTPNTPLPQTSYNGTLIIEPKTYTISSRFTQTEVTTSGLYVYNTLTNVSNNFSQNYYISADQVFECRAYGLRPNTQHSFNFNTANVSAFCMPQGGTLGANLISDANGTITFKYFYSSTLTANIVSNTALYTTTVQYLDLLSKVAGTKVATINNSDNTSFARDQVYFINQTSNTSGGGGRGSGAGAQLPWYRGVLDGEILVWREERDPIGPDVQDQEN